MNVPFESAIATGLNINIFQTIKERANSQTRRLAIEKGECPDAIGHGVRNSHLLAVAPNANSSIIAGTSPSIEPWKSNAYTHRTRVGSHLVKNPHLVKVLKEYSKDIKKSDIILLGVSRTSKTPTSIYLANKGYKVSNIPIVNKDSIPENIKKNKLNKNNLYNLILMNIINFVKKNSKTAEI